MSFIEKIVLYNSDKAALMYDDIPYSYSFLTTTVNKWIHLFRTYSLDGGKRIICMINNPVDFITCLSGLILTGNICIPMAPDSKHHEIITIAGDLDIHHIVTDDPALIKKAPAVDTEIISTGEIETIAGFDKQAAKQCIEQLRDEQEILYFQTSGTTGAKKYVIQTLETISNAVELSNKAYANTDNDCIFIGAPIFHSAGMMPALSALSANATCILMKKFFPKKFIRIIEKYKPCLVKAPAFMYYIIAKMNFKNVSIPKNSRSWFTGSAKLQQKYKQMLYDKFGVKVREMYATSETSLIAIEDEIEGDSFKPTPQCKVLEGISAEIREKGFIHVKTPALAWGYFNPDEGTKTRLEGFYRTGDIGKFDEKGLLCIEGRGRKDVNIAGKKVNVTEVNSVLLKHPQIQEAVTFGYKDDSETEVLAACVVCNKKISLKEISTYCSHFLSNYKIPRHIIMRDKMPVGSLGKVDIHSILKGVDNG